MKNFENKSAIILGFGVEGESTAEFLLSHQADITIADYKKREDFDAKTVTSFEEKGVKFIFESIPPLVDFDVIVRSPGVPLSIPQIREAQAVGKQITSATKLFFDLCPCEIIGVTGTKGKGTTSSLIYEMLKKQGTDAYLGGNIGVPPLTFLHHLKEDSKVVLELSSFQLQDLEKSPHIGVMLMITSEHLDYHKDTQEYVEAKRNIVAHQTREDFAILNHDYPATNESDIYTEGKVYHVSREQEVHEGCFIKDDLVVVRRAMKEEVVSRIQDILLPGRHNLENVCAAIMAALLSGVEKKTIHEVLKTFKGLEHRLELVATVNGVRYYDDSFSTTPETAQAAIEAFDAPEILILGGSSKNSDFSSLGRLISEKENIKAIIGVGVEWARIKAEIRNQKSNILLLEGAKDMYSIVQAASKVATLGDVVILTPACASFDMFKNYKERGNQFKEEVKNLKVNTSQ